MRFALCVLLCAVAHAEKPRLAAIAPAEWLPVLKPWVEARQRAFEVEAVAIEDVLASNDGRDAPERIKRFLWRSWRDRGLRYALLVGDADTFPFRFMVLDRCTPAAFDTAFYPSDLYYGDVAKADGSFDDWNGKTDAHHALYFGEVQGEKVKEPPINLDGISYAPEIAVGRWPVSNATDLAAVVAKTLAWSPEARKALVIHQDGWIDAAARVGSWGDALGSKEWTVDRQIHGAMAPTPATVLAALKAGVALALHSGHGEAWGWDRCLGPEEEKALADAPPAIYASVGCGTAVVAVQPPYEAYLDVHGILHKGTNNGEVFSAPPPPPSPLQPGRLERSSIAERLVRAPKGGAVAYFGCTTGSQPCALTLLEGLALYAAEGKGPRRLGDAWSFAVARYWREERLADLVPTADWYPPSIFFQGMKFILLGDPSLPLP